MGGGVGATVGRTETGFDPVTVLRIVGLIEQDGPGREATDDGGRLAVDRDGGRL